MKHLFLSGMIAVALSGCSSKESETVSAVHPATAPSTQATNSADRIVAIVNDRPITMAQLEGPLIEGYGLNVLLNIVQLELVKQKAQLANLTVTPTDIANERDLTMNKMFRDAAKTDYPQLLEQFLTQQKISRPEFDLVIETNAYLRKLAEPGLKGKITEENLQEAFRSMYGATVQVRHIQVSNMQEIAEAKRKLAGGASFEQVAKEMSRDKATAPLGGELPPFSMQTPGFAQSFKETAFALKEGEVSDPVESNGAFHLIKLEKKFPPKAVKFEDVKESVRAQLYDGWMQATIRDFRQQVAQAAIQTLEIKDPVLKAQFDEKMNKQQSAIRDREKIDQELIKERERLRNQQNFVEPSTGPATAPASAPATAPPSPPATKATTRAGGV